MARKSRIFLFGILSFSLTVSLACSSEKSSKGSGGSAPSSDDQKGKSASKSSSSKNKGKNKTQDKSKGDADSDDDQSGGGDSASASLLDLMTGSWVGECEEDQTDASPPEIFYKVETLTFASDDSFQEEEAEFTDDSCSSPRAGGDKKVVNKSRNVKISKEVSPDTVFINFTRISKMNDDTKTLESISEDLSALVQVSDSELTFDKKATADAGFTDKSETYTKR